MGIFYTMKQFFDGVAETRVAMWVMIAGNVVNIFGNWLLIYGVAKIADTKRTRMYLAEPCAHGSSHGGNRDRQEEVRPVPSRHFA